MALTAHSAPRASRAEPAPEPAAAIAPALAAALRGYLDHLAVERGLARNTLLSYRRDLTGYARFLTGGGITQPGAVTEKDVAGYLGSLRAPTDGSTPLAAASAARALIAARGWHRYLHAEGLSAGDPSRDVHPPQAAKRLPKALPIEQVTILLDAAGRGDGPRGLRDAALLEFLYATGARISEAVGLDVDDIDPEGEVVRLLGKGSKERIVPVGSYALRAIEAYRVRGRPALAGAGRGTAALFVNVRGGRLSRQSAWQVLRDAAERAEIGQPVSPHTLRHSFATHLLAGGADVRSVQELLGHASVTTTQIYTLVTVDSLREVYAVAHPRARAPGGPTGRPRRR